MYRIMWVHKHQFIKRASPITKRGSPYDQISSRRDSVILNQLTVYPKALVTERTSRKTLITTERNPKLPNRMGVLRAESPGRSLELTRRRRCGKPTVESRDRIQRFPE